MNDPSSRQCAARCVALPTLGRIRGLAAASLLAACSAPARYVIVADPAEVRLSHADERLVLLSYPDAAPHAAMLGLRERSMVERYGHERAASGGPLEQVLYQIVSGQYAAAEETLRAHAEDVPAYLRPLLVADLAFERASASPKKLLELYQAAYEAQGSERARAIVKLRIRQMRYER